MATRSSYDQVKEFNGKRYTGMAVGRSHKWRYDAGEWKERKVTPDRWEFTYAVVKRRSGRAPEGSGAPVGTAYHWYIVADQTVTKLDANSYMTEMVGHKLKLGHRRADKTSWNASDRAQRKQLVKLLRELIVDLEKPQEETVTGDGASAPRKQPARASRARAAVASRATSRTSRSAHRTARTAKQPKHRARSARAAAPRKPPRHGSRVTATRARQH
jgi:hypothetical protein